jgi:hypothetical protein
VLTELRTGRCAEAACGVIVAAPSEKTTTSSVAGLAKSTSVGSPKAWGIVIIVVRTEASKCCRLGVIGVLAEASETTAAERHDYCHAAGAVRDRWKLVRMGAKQSSRVCGLTLREELSSRKSIDELIRIAVTAAVIVIEN